jgi:hypothetical protein
METETVQAAARALAKAGPGAEVPDSPDVNGESRVAGGNGGMPSGTAFAAPPATDASSRWGGLPAPWEPVPEFMMWSSAENTHSADLAPAPAVSTAANGVAGTGESSVQRAAQGRPSGDGQPARSEGAQDKPQKQVPPDLDQLARQVYSIMKRRLAAERRRELLQ